MNIFKKKIRCSVPFNEAGDRWCAGCRAYKPIDQFTPSVIAGTKPQAYCKSCRHEKAMHPVASSKRKARSWERLYGMSEEQYYQLLDEQNGVCAICGEHETRIYKGTVGRLQVHHNHSTGKVISLLCSKCNAILGQAHDNPAYLDRLANHARIGYSEQLEVGE